jgi:hypothetical protein
MSEMPDVPLAPAPTLNAIEDPPTTLDAIEHPQTEPAPPADTAVLITEHEVVLATAAAVPLPRESTSHRLVAMLRALVAGWTHPSPPRRRPSAPSRFYYIERARMSREMERL